MKKIFNSYLNLMPLVCILVLFFGISLISCKDLQTKKPGTDVFKRESIKTTSIYQTELKKVLEDKSIDDYYKNIYYKEKLILADDYDPLLIIDNLFTNDSSTKLFYFIVFTKSMNGSDGFFSEALGVSALEFITIKTEWFAHYFIQVPKLTEIDMDNWANFIYGEIQISEEGHQIEAINKLEKLVLNNIKATRKEYKPIIENLIDKIRKAHTDSE